MKKFKEILKASGLDKLKMKEGAILLYSIMSFMMMVSCNYEIAPWYIAPILIVNFVISVVAVQVFIPKKFWIEDEDNDDEL